MQSGDSDSPVLLGNESFYLHSGEKDVRIGNREVKRFEKFIARAGRSDDIEDMRFVEGEIFTIDVGLRKSHIDAECSKDICRFGDRCRAEFEELMRAP